MASNAEKDKALAAARAVNKRVLEIRTNVWKLIAETDKRLKEVEIGSERYCYLAAYRSGLFAALEAVDTLPPFGDKSDCQTLEQ